MATDDDVPAALSGSLSTGQAPLPDVSADELRSALAVLARVAADRKTLQRALEQALLLTP